MPRFLRVGNLMVHVPSLSSVTIGTTCMGRPILTLSYHSTKKVDIVGYVNWDLCQSDFNRVKDALTEVESLLSKIALTEPSLGKVNTEVENKMLELKKTIDEMDVSVKEGLRNTVIQAEEK